MNKKQRFLLGSTFTVVLSVGLFFLSSFHPYAGNEKGEPSGHHARSEVSPSQALKRLKEGNERFVNNRPIVYPVKAQIKETSHGQHPFAAVLSCIDSRVPSELVFNQGIGHLFSVRVAGNVASNDVLASLEYAVAVSGVNLIVVMGHSDCGAIKGACDAVKLGNLTDLLAKMRYSVTQESSVKEDRTSQNKEFVSKVSEINVFNSIEEMLYRSPVISELYQKKQIDIVPAFYDVETGHVHFDKYVPNKKALSRKNS